MVIYQGGFIQDKILLGFLMSGKKTGYEIKKIMEKSTHFIFNTSLGSIYPAFKKLENKCYINLDQKIESGKLKKVYSITPEGKEYFLDWMYTPTLKSHIILLKIFFFSYISTDKRKIIIKDYLDLLRKEHHELQELEIFLKNTQINYFESKTLQYGLDHYAFLKNWFEIFYQNLKK